MCRAVVFERCTFKFEVARVVLVGGYSDFNRCGIVAVCVAFYTRPVVVVVVYSYLCRVAVVCYGGNSGAIYPLGLCTCCKSREAACGERYLTQRYAVDMRPLRRYCANGGRCGFDGDNYLIGICAVFGVITFYIRPVVVVVVDGDRNLYAVLALCYGGLIFGVCPLPIAGKSYVANGLAVGYFIIAEVGNCGSRCLRFDDREICAYAALIVAVRSSCQRYPSRARVGVVAVTYLVIVGL